MTEPGTHAQKVADCAKCGRSILRGRHGWLALDGDTRHWDCDIARARDREAEVKRLRAALRSIYQMPCAHPDDPDEDRKLAAQFANAQDIAHNALSEEPDPA